ncbi:MAG: FGGY family carbohydrate kinase [Candidatus Sumerlaeia bacterium]|nr:FGGY family carbohydrate kinase [Candidatus Sumerlaeia bacterium]
MTILAVDIGTSCMKMGVYQPEGKSLQLIRSVSRSYSIHTYNEGLYSDIQPEKWKQAFVAGCKAMKDAMAAVEVVALSGTTPGLTAMDHRGQALYPAILMLDQRSRAQAQRIINTIGVATLLDITGNIPVAGGCSLAGILWLKDCCPHVFRKTAVFGHSNTYLAAWLTGRFAMDPSSASLTALYNTVRNDRTWNRDLAGAFGLTLDRLPDLIPAQESVGRVKASQARALGLRKMPQVVIGGNDAVLAAYAAGVRETGQILNVNGTCEITLVCLPQCIPSPRYNLRAHVIPNRWLTLHVMNAGGKALEWFRSVFCSEMPADEFYAGFLPKALEQWLDKTSRVHYTPYLLGSRYSQKPLRAQLRGLTAATTREEILAAIVRGLCRYQRSHLKAIGTQIRLDRTIHLAGGALNPWLIKAKGKWMWDADYAVHEHSSLRGAALLGYDYLRRGP